MEYSRDGGGDKDWVFGISACWNAQSEVGCVECGGLWRGGECIRWSRYEGYTGFEYSMT